MVKKQNPYLICNRALSVRIGRLTRSIHLPGSFQNTPASVLGAYANLLRLRDYAELYQSLEVRDLDEHYGQK